MSNDIEILVHTAAPSRGKDDSRYRAFATAYLAFEPRGCERLYITNQDNKRLGQEWNDGLPYGQAHKSSQQGIVHQNGQQHQHDHDSHALVDVASQVPSHRTYLTRSFHGGPGLLNSPQASFNSILDNANSPELLAGVQPGAFGVLPGSSPSIPGGISPWQPPPSVIEDSQSPYNRAIPEFSSPTRILELYLQELDSPDIESRHFICSRPSVRAISDASSKSIIEAQTQFHGVEEETSTHYSGEISSLDPSVTSGQASIQTANTAKRMRSKTQTIPQRQDLVNTSRARYPSNVVESSEALGLTLRERKRKTHPGRSEDALAGEVNRGRWSIYNKLDQNTVHAPPPPTSLSSTVMNASSPLLITPPLVQLATELALPARFRPKSQLRDLRPLERGYWTVPITSWPADLRERSWMFLQAFVGLGKAGWGVWCERSGSNGLRNTAKDKGKGREGEETVGAADNEVLRVFCWGVIVGHIYVLLYLASERKIKGVGARWIDGGGEVVIAMDT